MTDKWEQGELRVITDVNPSGSIGLCHPDALMEHQKGRGSWHGGKIFPGDWIVPLAKEWVQGAHADYVKVLTKHGIAHISEFILIRNSKPMDKPDDHPIGR